MIRFSVLYPKTEGARFDHDYYRDRHVPLAVETWGIGEDQVAIDRGLDGPYEAAVHFTFVSTDTLAAALGAEGSGAVMADVANYTDIVPVVQTSEIVA
ncbi:MAG: EthD family reductase [Actinomycetota bacterium]